MAGVAFDRYLEYKSDEIDNAAYALAAALLRNHPEQTNAEVLPWDMSIIAPIAEAAQAVLEKHGKPSCWPFYKEAKECYRTGRCKNMHCYFTAEKEGATEE